MIENQQMSPSTISSYKLAMAVYHGKHDFQHSANQYALIMNNDWSVTRQLLTP